MVERCRGDCVVTMQCRTEGQVMVVLGWFSGDKVK